MYIRTKRKQKQGIFLSPRNPHPQILIKSRLEMKNENDHLLFLRTSHHLYVLFHITRVKTIQPLILHISSTETYPRCAIFSPQSSPFLARCRPTGEGERVAIKLYALYSLILRNRSCVAHVDVFPYQADAFRQDLQGDGT